MNFQQLRIIRETVRRDFNLTEVANALFTSQSGVSKHIKDLEDELGVELFVRRGKRLLGLTDPGKEMVEIVERVLADTASIKRLGEQFSNREQGKLVIATTHLQARYVLPHVVAAFRTAYPKVHLMLHQGSPGEIAAMLSGGEADIGICTETLSNVPSLITFTLPVTVKGSPRPERLCPTFSVTILPTPALAASAAASASTMVQMLMRSALSAPEWRSAASTAVESPAPPPDGASPASLAALARL